MIQIALVEDHIPSMNRFEKFINNTSNCILVLKAFDGQDLLIKMHTQKELPDIILVDINMPMIDGIAITYYLKLHFPSIKVIGLSTYCDENIIYNIIANGAAGFVMKALAENVLDNAIHKVFNHEIYVDERAEFNEVDIQKIVAKRKIRFHNADSFTLTTRERTFIMLNATLLSFEQIAEIMFVEPKTIQTYFERVSKKLNTKTRQALMIFSLQNGLAAIANFH
jgi:DNA-binding NarL/FixJ family response regulator